MKTQFVFAGLLASTAVAGPAGAQALPPLTVTRDAAASDCPDAPVLARRVARTLGKPLSYDTTHIHVEISRDLDGYAAIVRATGTRAGERRVRDVGPTCKSLADALVVMLAIVMDDDGEALGPAWTTDSTGAPTMEPTAHHPPTQERTENFVLVDASAGAHFGVFDRPGPLVRVGAGVTGSVPWMRATVVYAPPQEIRRDVSHTGAITGRSRPGVRLQLLATSFELCGSFIFKHVTLRSCPGFLVGWLRAEGLSGISIEQRFTRRFTRHHVWGAWVGTFGLEGIVSRPIHWFVRGTLGFALPQRFFVTTTSGTEDILRTDPEIAFAEAGLRIVFR